MQHLIIKRKQAVQLQILQSMRLEVAEYPCHVKTRALPLGGGGGSCISPERHSVCSKQSTS